MGRSNRARELSAWRRKEADGRIEEVRGLVAEILRRDDDMRHVTLFLDPGRERVEWYPGGAKWSLPDTPSSFVEGEIDGLLAWLENEKRGFHRRARSTDDFDLIDTEDRF